MMHIYISYFLAFHCILTQILYISKGFCPTYLREPYMDDRLYMSYINMLNTTHMGECIQACSGVALCSSFFYNRGTKQCALVEGGLSSSVTTEKSTGWIYYDCYYSEYNTSTMFYFGNEGVPWETAKSKCRERKAYLAEPDNENLFNFFKQKVLEKGGFMYWTGGKFTPEHKWRWDRFNTSITYKNWYPHEDLSEPMYLMMPYKEKWLPSKGSDEHRYACQRETV